MLHFRRTLTAVPALLIAVVPHAATCPACWPLVGGLVSSLGLAFLVETRYLLPLSIGCLALAVGALGYRAERNYAPMIVGVVASALILSGKFVFASTAVTITGACLLIAAYAWRFWLRRSCATSACKQCDAPSASTAVTGSSDEKSS